MSKDKPLKILMLLNRVPFPLNDGGAIGAYNFIKGYHDAGAELTILALNTSKHFVSSNDIDEHISSLGKIETVYIDNRIKLLPALLNLFTSKSYIIQRFVSNAFTRKLTDLLQSTSFDVVHVDGLPPTAYIDTVRKYSKAYVSMRAHNVEHVIWERIASEETNVMKKFYVRIQAKRLKRYETDAWKKCDYVMAISRDDLNVINHVAPNINAEIVPAGMEISELPVNTNFNASDLHFIGSFDWQPNLQGIKWFVDDVWDSIYAKIPHLNFYVAGKSMPDSIRKINKNGCHMLGPVDSATQFILEHGVMLVPLVSGSGIRIKIVEAMALGKTVIATSIAAEGLGLTNEENVLLANNSEEFIAQITKCINDPEFCKQVGVNAHRFSKENFQNKTIFARLTEHYKKIEA